MVQYLPRWWWSEGRDDERTAAIFGNQTLWYCLPLSGAQTEQIGYTRQEASNALAGLDTLGQLLDLRLSPVDEQHRE